MSENGRVPGQGTSAEHDILTDGRDINHTKGNDLEKELRDDGETN